MRELTPAMIRASFEYWLSHQPIRPVALAVRIEIGRKIRDRHRAEAISAEQKAIPR